MSGVWLFDKNGVARLITNPTRESFERRERPGSSETATAPGARPLVLVYLPANQVVRSYATLEQQLKELGWTRYANPTRLDMLQFHRDDSTAHLISLPISFCKLKPHHMYDIVVKTRSFIAIRDSTVQPKD